MAVFSLLRGFCARLHLGNLAPAPGSNPARKRVGRGAGRFCGRGAAGQNSRPGPGPPRGFAGGQTPLHISTPKFGFVNPYMGGLAWVVGDGCFGGFV